jgi:hypothetical protein
MQRSTFTRARDAERVLERARLLGDGDLFRVCASSDSSSLMVACIVLSLAPEAAMLLLLEADACLPRCSPRGGGFLSLLGSPWRRTCAVPVVSLFFFSRAESGIFEFPLFLRAASADAMVLAAF